MSRVRPVARTVELLRDFFRLQSAARIVLMAAAALAMIAAHSPWHDAYQAFRHLPCLLSTSSCL